MSKRKLKSLEDSVPDPQKKTKKNNEYRDFFKKMEYLFVLKGYKKNEQETVSKYIQELTEKERMDIAEKKVSEILIKIHSNKILIDSIVRELNFDLLKKFNEVNKLNQELLESNQRLIDVNNSLHEIYEQEKICCPSLKENFSEMTEDEKKFIESIDFTDDTILENKEDIEHLPFPECLNFNENEDPIEILDELIVY